MDHLLSGLGEKYNDLDQVEMPNEFWNIFDTFDDGDFDVFDELLEAPAKMIKTNDGSGHKSNTQMPVVNNLPANSYDSLQMIRERVQERIRKEEARKKRRQASATKAPATLHHTVVAPPPFDNAAQFEFRKQKILQLFEAFNVGDSNEVVNVAKGVFDPHVCIKSCTGYFRDIVGRCRACLWFYFMCDACPDAMYVVQDVSAVDENDAEFGTPSALSSAAYGYIDTLFTPPRLTNKIRFTFKFTGTRIYSKPLPLLFERVQHKLDKLFLGEDEEDEKMSPKGRSSSSCEKDKKLIQEKIRAASKEEDKCLSEVMGSGTAESKAFTSPTAAHSKGTAESKCCTAAAGSNRSNSVGSDHETDSTVTDDWNASGNSSRNTSSGSTNTKLNNYNNSHNNASHNTTTISDHDREILNGPPPFKLPPYNKNIDPIQQADIDMKPFLGSRRDEYIRKVYEILNRCYHDDQEDDDDEQMREYERVLMKSKGFCMTLTENKYDVGPSSHPVSQITGIKTYIVTFNEQNLVTNLQVGMKPDPQS